MSYFVKSIYRDKMHLTARDLYEVPVQKEIEMQTYYEVVLHPGDYMSMGDKEIVNAPLIRTSLQEMEKCGWKMHVEMRMIHSPLMNSKEFGDDRVRKVRNSTHVKVRVCFWDPLEPNRRMVFKFWDQASWNFLDNMTVTRVLDFIHNRDLNPKFTNHYHKLFLQPPVVPKEVFNPPEEIVVENLMPVNNLRRIDENTFQIVDVVPALTIEKVLENFSVTEILQYVNEMRVATIKLPGEEPTLHTEDVLSLDEDSLEALIIQFPFRSSTEISESLRDKIENLLYEEAA